MDNTYVFIIILILAIIILVTVFALTYLLYQNMLLNNEINKRLLAISSEAMLNVKITQEEVDQLINNLDKPPKEASSLFEGEDEQTTFDPHAMNER